MENAEEAGQGLSATGRGGQQDGLAIQNCGHAEQLSMREIGISRPKPLAQSGMQFRGERFGRFECGFRGSGGGHHVEWQRNISRLSEHPGRDPSVRARHGASPSDWRTGLALSARLGMTILRAPTSGFRIYREMFVLQMLRYTLGLLGFDLFCC